jgi:hypothetical protein
VGPTFGYDGFIEQEIRPERVGLGSSEGTGHQALGAAAVDLGVVAAIRAA